MATMVLLVDDDEDLLEMLELLFTQEGIPHVSARSLAAVQALGERIDDVTTAILDVNLGVREPSGVAVAAWLRERRPDVRVIFITGHAPEHPLVIEATGARGQILAKPIDTHHLLELARGEP